MRAVHLAFALLIASFIVFHYFTPPILPVGAVGAWVLAMFAAAVLMLARLWE